MPVKPDQAGGFGAWLLVAVLMLAYAMSFIDRQILSLLVADLRSDLAIGDFEIGLLQGPAFGVFYALLGMPLGILADRINRIRLIAAGLFVWSAMTILGGFTTGFYSLLATRMGVGMGEAALVPAAVSLLADRFPARERALPLAVFTTGISVGAGLALMAGGWLVAFAANGAQQLPLIGGLFVARAGWQSVLILAGLLGMPLVVLVLLLPEPARATSHDTSVGLGRFLLGHPKLFGPLLGGTALLYLFANALSAWMPTLFIRRFGWNAAEVGQAMGLVILLAAFAGNLLSGTLARRLLRRGHASGALQVMGWGAALLVPFAVLGPLASSAAMLAGLLGGTYFALALCFGVATTAFAAITPAALRGRMVALYLLVGNLVGLGVGPPLVGFVTGLIPRHSNPVGLALAGVAAFAVLGGAALLRIALQRSDPVANEFAE